VPVWKLDVHAAQFVPGAVPDDYKTMVAGAALLYGLGRCSILDQIDRGSVMAKGQQKKSKEARKPKKVAPPKGNASAPSSKGVIANLSKD
jgi:hypothetical protein